MLEKSVLQCGFLIDIIIQVTINFVAFAIETSHMLATCYDSYSAVGGRGSIMFILVALTVGSDADLADLSV